MRLYDYGYIHTTCVKWQQITCSTGSGSGSLLNISNSSEFSLTRITRNAIRLVDTALSKHDFRCSTTPLCISVNLAIQRTYSCLFFYCICICFCVCRNGMCKQNYIIPMIGTQCMFAVYFIIFLTRHPISHYSSSGM